MKTIIYLLLTILVFNYTNAQAPAIEWQKSYGGSSNDIAKSIEQTPDGGYIMAGITESNDGDVTGFHGITDFWVIKIDATGNIQWQKALGGTNKDNATCVKNTNDGGYIVLGYTQSNNGDVTGFHGFYDYWLVKLDTNGNIQWQKTLGGSNYDVGSSVQTTADGGYIVAGASNSTDGDVTQNYGYEDFWVVKLNSTGNIQWQKSIGGIGSEFAFAIQTTLDGGYVVAGEGSQVIGNANTFDFLVVKLDATGTIQWQKLYGGSNQEIANTIQTTIDGGYIVAGQSLSTDRDVTENHGVADYWIVKLDALGNIMWQKSIGGSQWDEAFSVVTTSDGGCVVAGNSPSTNGNINQNLGGPDYWIVKLDATGTLQWQKSLGGTYSDYAYSIQKTIDGGYIVAGSSDSNNGNVTGNHGNSDFWAVKLAPDALATPVFEKQTILIYPNPVQDKLQIQSSSLTQVTKVKIIDVQGKIVLEQSQKTNTINVENLAKGIYMLETYSGNEKQVSKFVKD